MTTENYVSTTELPKARSYFSSAFDKAGSQARLFAKKLHEIGYIYALYGALDGLSLSYSTLKYAFDVFLTNSSLSSADVMHTWMMTPTGIAVAATESITIIVFSLMANVFDDNSSNLFKKYTTILWPYVRDVMKSLKNSYKGVRSAITVINILGNSASVNLNFLMLPVGLLLGGLSVLNRLAFRSLIESRKDMMKANKSALANIKKEGSLTAKQCEDYRQEMARQSQSTAARCAGYLSQAYSGVVDSLYLYVGVLGLCSLAWPALLAMSIFCVIYSLANVAARLYEEFDNQQKLLIRHAKIDLHLYGKEHGQAIQDAFLTLQQLQKEIMELDPKNHDALLLLQQQQQQLATEIRDKIKTFSQKRDHLKALSTTSFTSAFFLGIKNGLHAYGALNSALFALATVLLLCSTAFPAALLISAISAGMALLIGFVSWTLITTYRQHSKQVAIDAPYDSLLAMVETLQHPSMTAQPEDAYSKDVHDIIKRSLLLDPSPQYAFQEGFEVIRSLFSGLPKGNKSIDYTLNPLQEVDAAGHCHDTPIMFVLSAFSAVVYAATMALRAFARGFGRGSLDQDEDITAPAVVVIDKPVVVNDTNNTTNNTTSPDTLPVVEPTTSTPDSSTKESVSEETKPDVKVSSPSPNEWRASSCPQIFFSPSPPLSPPPSPQRPATAPLENAYAL